MLQVFIKYFTCQSSKLAPMNEKMYSLVFLVKKIR
jgi:hypothetical protein